MPLRISLRVPRCACRCHFTRLYFSPAKATLRTKLKSAEVVLMMVDDVTEVMLRLFTHTHARAQTQFEGNTWYKTNE